MSVIALLAVPAWLYLWLGSQVDAPRVVIFVVGYVLLGIALTGPRSDTERRPMSRSR